MSGRYFLSFLVVGLCGPLSLFTAILANYAVDYDLWLVGYILCFISANALALAIFGFLNLREGDF